MTPSLGINLHLVVSPDIKYIDSKNPTKEINIARYKEKATFTSASIRQAHFKFQARQSMIPQVPSLSRTVCILRKIKNGSNRTISDYGVSSSTFVWMA